MRIGRETWILGAICLADLVYTVWLLQTGAAMEVNPLLRFYLGYGLLAFVAAKLLLSFGALAGIEWARVRRPQSIARLMRVGIALYVGFYAFGLWQVNRPQNAELRAYVRDSGLGVAATGSLFDGQSGMRERS